MASFTAKDVQALREKTNVGMMDCKRALAASDGDMDKAIDFLREKGLAASVKKAGRITAEGAVAAFYDAEKKVGAMAEINSETDFVAKNDVFKAFCADVVKTVAQANPASMETLLAARLSGSDRTVEENLRDKILSIGENMTIRRFVRVEGVVSIYIHAGGSVGALVEFETDDATAAKPEFAVMGKNVAMQIAAMSPLYLDEASVPADVIAKEKEINLASLNEDPKMSGKPDQVKAKIIDGKLKKYFSAVCLLDQTYVRDDGTNVRGYVDSTAKALGAEIKVKSFFRYAKGEGIQKKENNFAAEVASMA